MDRQVVEQKLESLRRCLARLRVKCPASAEALEADIDAQDIVALNLTRAVQLSVDLAMHWMMDFPDIPALATMSSAFDGLARMGRLDPALALRLKKAVGFRNVAVHNYDKVNWQIVYSICTSRLVDFDQFATAVSAAIG